MLPSPPNRHGRPSRRSVRASWRRRNRRVHARPRYLGDGVFDDDAWLVIDRMAARHALDEFQPGQPLPGRQRGARVAALASSIRPALEMSSDRTIATSAMPRSRPRRSGAVRRAGRIGRPPHVRCARSGTPANEWKVPAGLGFIGEIGMARRLVEVERRYLFGDRPDQPLAHREPRHVHRRLFQTACREQFEQAVAQQINRTDLARQRFSDDRRDLVELGCALVRAAMTSCNRVRISRAEAAAVGMARANRSHWGALRLATLLQLIEQLDPRMEAERARAKLRVGGHQGGVEFDRVVKIDAVLDRMPQLRSRAVRLRGRRACRT